MAAPLIGAPPLFRFHHPHFQVATCLLAHRSWCCAADSTHPDKASSSVFQTAAATLSAKDPPKYPRRDDPEFGKWKQKEAEILKDIEPIIYLTKQILHSNRYIDGERLSAEDEKVVVDKLLAYHPHSEDKIGCGLDSIMVDRHPQFRHSRCLFVVRTDGGWIDFSYQKCIRAYIRGVTSESNNRIGEESIFVCLPAGTFYGFWVGSSSHQINSSLSSRKYIIIESRD